MITPDSQQNPAGFDERELIAVIPRMRAFARSLCGDQTWADDITQDALVRAWRGRDSFARGTNFRAWVFAIVRNQFYSDRRRSWRVSQLDPTVAEETLIAPSYPSATLELDELRRAMLELPDEHREALILVAVAELTYAEVAFICGCAEGTIKSRVSRARRRLQYIVDRSKLTTVKQPPALAMASILADARDLSARHFSSRPNCGAEAVAEPNVRLVPQLA